MQRLSLMMSHWSIPAMILAVLAGGLSLWLQAPAWLWFLVPLGILAQMLNEYSMHRYIFHLAPPRRQWQFNLLYMAHYGHHDFPTHPRLFFAPGWVTLPVLAINYAALFGLLRLAGLDQAFNIATAVVPVGGALTFLGYEWFHMTAHLPVGKTRVERHVTTLHNQHHFRDFSRWFHVSPGGEVIDRLMGTAIDREALKSKQRIEFIRTLGMTPDDSRLVAARHHYAAKYGLSPADIARAARG